MWLYSPCHITDRGIICRRHLPVARQAETTQGSAEENELCWHPPGPCPGHLAFLYMMGDLVEAPRSIGSLHREHYCHLLSPQSKQFRKVNRKPPVTGNPLDFAQAENFTVTLETNENEGKHCGTCNQLLGEQPRGQAAKAVRTVGSRFRLPGSTSCLCHLPAL